ncbi:endonuclease/exonuclease/phosphatase family protein [Actinosynnema sp. CS-041913]|uniref:endonuclease/exonuclease/phosphatase family protein n=1 Tax=Actinosynnema sp. CS-041913 TaxID=3239917 RepID=UPI003D89DEC2
MCNIGSCSAEATLTVNGSGREILTVKDNHADDSSAVAVYWVEGRTGPPVYVWAHGAGTTTVHQIEPDVPAGKYVKFRACIGEYGARQVLWDTCGETQQPAGVTASPDQPASTFASRSTAPFLEDRVKVMTWNLGAGAEFEEINGWADTIAAHRPDIVGVQEACKNDIDGVAKRLRETHGLDYQLEYGMVESKAYCGIPTSDFGQAMLSLRPMTDVKMVRYATQSSEEKRGYMYGTVDVDGALVRVFNTHLEEPGTPELTAQAKELAEATMAVPRALVLGDLNASPEVGRETTYRPPDQHLALVPLFNAGLRDIDRNCNRNTNPGCAGTRINSGRKYDYIFMRLLTETARPTVPDTTFSDHRPVIGTVRLSPDWAEASACNYNSCVSKVTFQPDGEHLYVEDANANGLSAVGVYWVQGRGRNHTVVWNSHGHDSPDNPVDANLEIAEGQWVMYRACSGDGGTRTVFWDTCGNVHFAFA